MTRHHPSTIASPGTARPVTISVPLAPDLTKLVAEMAKLQESNNRLVDQLTRMLKIATFSKNNGASPNPDDWNETDKMLFAIQHPEVTL